ncbi:hypothetical protein ABPG72_004865 [Tetrahymena utriculariae]
MLRQTINIIEQQKAMRMMMMPRLVVSNNNITQQKQKATNIQQNSHSQSAAAMPKFDWNPVKYNFNFELLQNEYANYCKQYNIVNRFDKQSKQESNKPIEAQADQLYLQTVVFNPTLSFNSFSTAEFEDIIFEMQSKRSKQAKKKRSKRKSGGHQSIRC